ADSAPTGVYTATPQHCAVAASLPATPKRRERGCEALVSCLFPASLTERRLQALEIATAVSRRKHLFSSAASSGVSGGTNRVFTRPACGALVMTANAQRPCPPRSGRFGARTRNGFIR